jgi:hypothetical protein
MRLRTIADSIRQQKRGASERRRGTFGNKTAPAVSVPGLFDCLERSNDVRVVQVLKLPDYGEQRINPSRLRCGASERRPAPFRF